MPFTTPKLGDFINRSEALDRPQPKSHYGCFISLEAIDPASHAADLYEASHHCPEAIEIWTYLPMAGPFVDVRAMELWLEECRASRDFVFFAVRHRESGRVVGMLSFADVDPRMHRLELGFIWYDPRYQQTNVNTESVYLLLIEAFEHLGYRRVEWKCDSLNQDARCAALRLGFSFEGVFRKHMIVNGRNRDTSWFAMTDDDWQKLKPNYHRWLYENDGYLSLTELNNSLLFSSLAML